MTEKQKWIATAFILASLIGIVCAIKFLPLWMTIVALGSAIFGGVCGWNLKGKNITDVLS